MEKWKNLKRLTDSGIVAVIRRPKESQIHRIAEALVQGGVGALEITVDTPGVFEMIRAIKASLGEWVLVGAGTVLDAHTAKQPLRPVRILFFHQLWIKRRFSSQTNTVKFPFRGL
jgi:2-dehydro-3-deoxyphosphogluconate aldolase / (4S)-4-hydroxy-2-oxoglutarate aldolase